MESAVTVMSRIGLITRFIRNKEAPAVKPVKAAGKKAAAEASAAITPEARYRLVCEAAYFRAEQRGFTGGDPHADWTAAEAEVDRKLAATGK